MSVILFMCLCACLLFIGAWVGGHRRACTHGSHHRDYRRRLRSWLVCRQRDRHNKKVAPVLPAPKAPQVPRINIVGRMCPGHAVLQGDVIIEMMLGVMKNERAARTADRQIGDGHVIAGDVVCYADCGEDSGLDYLVESEESWALLHHTHDSFVFPAGSYGLRFRLNP